MKVYPGFADPDGPCCTRRPLNPQSVFSDTHFKTTMPSQHFGLSIARLPNDHFAVGSSNKAFVLPLRNRAASHITLPDDITSPKETPIMVSSHGSRSVFLANGKAYIYRSEVSDVGNLELKRIAILGNCKSVSTVPCVANNKWTDNVKHVMAINQNTVAITGINSMTNSSVAALFQERNGMWKLAQVLGKEINHTNFGHSLSLNKRFLAVATGEGINSSISVYSIETFTLLMTIGISDREKITSPFSLYLTESDALIMVSEKSKSVDVLQLNIMSSSYNDVCDFQVAHNEYVSGHLDVVARDGGYIMALGMLTSEGRDSVRLLGFHGIFTDNKLTKCANLGRVIARESGLRVDDGIPRTTVSFINDTVLFGAPDVVAWPGQGEDSGTGRIYIATYCPTDHVRVRVSQIKDIGSVRCTPCEAGRKSFGGFAEMCSECEGMSCSTLQSDNPFSFKSNICDAVSCHSQSIFNASTNGLNFSFANGSFFVPGPENLYTVQLLETTRANLSTRSLSESFVIDPTSPDPGLVYDGLGSDPNTNCSDNSTFGEESQCSTRDLKETDVDYTYNTREVHARWLDFLDEESDIVEYFWCVGTKPMTDDIRECESRGLRPNGSHYGLNLGQGDSYYVTVIACNGARRCSAAHSDGVTIDTTPPVMKYVRDGIMGPDMDFQVFVDIIFAYFSASDPESNVTSYEIAWGTAPGLTDVKEFEEVTNTTIWLAKFKDNALGVGNRYYATVRATNGAGLLSEELSSNGIVVGKSEYVFDNATSAEFFFDTVIVKEDGTRKDEGVGKTYGTLTVPEGAVEEQVKLRSYSLDDKTMDTNKTEEGPVSNPTYTRPKQFMLGNYSFVIKALDPQNNTVKEGFQFAKPITIAMFYDVDNLVKANSEHVNNELTKEDIDPVLYLWDSKNSSWFDAAFTCPEPWSHVNKSVNLLTVKVCHLTQFSFLWSFYAQNGLVLLDKNNSMYNEDGVVEVTRSRRVTILEFQLRRAKGSQGDITVQWSLYQNDSSDSMELMWPKSGHVSFTDGQWSDSFIINVDNSEEEVQQSVVWVQLDETTGGAVLASRDKTTAKILITGNEEKTGTWRWIVTGVFGGVLLIFVGVLVYRLRKRKQESQRTEHSRTEIELPYCGSMQRERGLAGEQMYSNGVDLLEPEPKTVSEVYGGDMGKPPVSPKRTHRALFPLSCTPDVRLAWRLEQTSAQELGSLSTSGKSVPRKRSDSKLQSTFGKKKRNKPRLTKCRSTTSKDKYCDGHELVLSPVSGDDERESSSSSMKMVDMRLTIPLYETVLNFSPEVSDADSLRCEEKGNCKSEERKKIYMRTTNGNRVDSQDGSAPK